MKRTRVVKLLNILSKKERTLLKKQIDSSDEDQTFKSLAKYVLINSDKPFMLEEGAILKAIKLKTTTEKLGQLSAQLFQFVENFVLNNWLNSLSKNDEEHQVQKDFLLLEYYKTKELPGNHKNINDLSKLIDLKQKKIKKNLDKNTANNIFHYYHQHRLNYHQYYGLNADILSKGKEYIGETMNHLDLFYGLAKLKFSGEIKLRNMLTTEQTEIFGVEEMSRFCINFEISNKETHTKQPIVKLYQLSNCLANNVNQENLSKLKNEIIINEDSLDNNELSQLLTLVINYNTYLSRHNNLDLSKNSYELLKLGLKREIFNVNGLIRPDFLINFAYLCTEFSNDKEIVSIMNQYKSRLLLNLKESTFNLCSAYILWYQKKYKEAIALIKKNPKRTFLFFVYQKLTQIKCIYELSQMEEFNMENDYINNMLVERNSLLKYLRSKKKTLNPYNFQALLNFSNMLLKLIEPSSTRKQLLSLMNFEYAQIFERRWLLRKIEAK